MISSGGSQKLLSFALLGILCIVFTPLVHLCCYIGTASTSVAANVWHDNAGVLRYVNPKIGTYGLTPNGSTYIED